MVPLHAQAHIGPGHRLLFNAQGGNKMGIILICLGIVFVIWLISFCSKRGEHRKLSYVFRRSLTTPAIFTLIFGVMLLISAFLSYDNYLEAKAFFDAKILI